MLIPSPVMQTRYHQRRKKIVLRNSSVLIAALFKENRIWDILLSWCSCLWNIQDVFCVWNWLNVISADSLSRLRMLSQINILMGNSWVWLHFSLEQRKTFAVPIGLEIRFSCWWCSSLYRWIHIHWSDELNEFGYYQLTWDYSFQWVDFFGRKIA